MNPLNIVFYFNFRRGKERIYTVRIFDMANDESNATNMVRFNQIYLQLIANSIKIKNLVHYFYILQFHRINLQSHFIRKTFVFGATW